MWCGVWDLAADGLGVQEEGKGLFCGVRDC